MERRLTTILSADIAGYSRLMEIDEQGTLSELKSRQEALVEPLLAKNGGRLIKMMGDGFQSASRRIHSARSATDLPRAFRSQATKLSGTARLPLARNFLLATRRTDRRASVFKARRVASIATRCQAVSVWICVGLA